MKEEFKASVNQISKGVHSDFIEEYQPEGTMRSSMNGEIISYEEGFYQWTNIKGDTQVFFLMDNKKIIAWCSINTELYVFIHDPLEVTISIAKITKINHTNSTCTTDYLHTYSNDDFKYDKDYPIRRIIGFYESEDVKNIYLTDFHNPPKIINVAGVQLNSKFLDWSPKLDNIGEFKFNFLDNGGNLNYGNYFFTWRYYTANGYYSDWSYLTNPVQVSSGNVGITHDDYQEYQGGDPSKNSGKAINFTLLDLDSDYKGIEIAYFYTDAYNNSGPGRIFDRKEISGSSLTFVLKGNENISEILINDLTISSITINKVKDFDIIKNINAIANIEEREELDIENTINVDITEENYPILIDTKPIPDQQSETYEKALFGIMNTDSYHSTKVMLPNVLYRSSGNVMNGQLQLNLFGRYMIFDNLQGYTSGIVTPIHAIKKYRKKNIASSPDNFDNYVIEEIPISGGFMDYKNPAVDNNFKGYPRDTKIRLGVLFWDLNGKPYFVRWLKDNTSNGDYRTSQYNTNPLLEGIGLTTLGSNTYYNYLFGNNISLLVSGLDITDIRDKISGFSIVRCPIEHEIISTGILTQIYDGSTNSHVQTNFNTSTLTIPSRRLKSYSYFSPEQLFEFGNFSIQRGDKIKNLEYLKSYNTTAATRGTADGAPNRFYEKFLMNDLTGGTQNGAVLAENEIISSANYEFGTDEFVYNPLLPQKPLSKYSAKQINDKIGNVSKHIIFNTKNSETDSDPIGIITSGRSQALLVGIKRQNNNPYGGTSKSALSNSKYIFCGHYQPINSQVLSDVLQSSGRYVFNEIQIFGGDTYVQLFDLNRLYYNYADASNKLGQAIVFPVETRINISLRTGNHIAKIRPYYTTINEDGIRYNSGGLDSKYEDFLYNKGYSSDNIYDYYPALPDFTTLENKFPNVIRYSLQKTIGEMFDKFRMFQTNSFISVDSRYGSITNVRKLRDYLIYWTPESVGYLPVLERQLSATELGAPIQMGVGGVLERSDELSTFGFGNSHQFSLIQSDQGFHWFNMLNKSFISLDNSMKLDKSSFAQGLNNFFRDNVKEALLEKDNPFDNKGIISGYDMVKRKVYMTFSQYAKEFTIVYDLKIQSFSGQISSNPTMYIYFNNIFIYSFNTPDGGLFLHLVGNSTKNISDESYVELIVTDEQMLSKIFTSIILKDNGNNFDRIIFTLPDGTVTDILKTANTNVLTNRNYKRIREELHGSIPKLSSRKRMNGSYISIKFVVHRASEDMTVALKKLITVYKNAY